MSNFKESRTEELKGYVKLYRPMVASIVNSAKSDNKYILNESDIDDILQDTIIVLYEKKNNPSFRLTSQESTFVYSIAKNKTMELLRKKGKTMPLNEDYDLEDTDYEHDDTKNLKEKFLAECISVMEGSKKLVLQMYFFDNCSMKMIAESLSLASDRVAITQMYRAKEFLFGCISKKLKNGR